MLMDDGQDCVLGVCILIPFTLEQKDGRGVCWITCGHGSDLEMYYDEHEGNQICTISLFFYHLVPLLARLRISQNSKCLLA